MLADIAIVNNMELMNNIISIARLDESRFKTIFGNNSAGIYYFSYSYRIPFDILIGNKVESARHKSAKPFEDEKHVHKGSRDRYRRDIYDGLFNKL